jgi:hypothetical protein
MCVLILKTKTTRIRGGLPPRNSIITKINDVINSFIESKKLNLSKSKCHGIRVKGKKGVKGPQYNNEGVPIRKISW